MFMSCHVLPTQALPGGLNITDSQDVSSVNLLGVKHNVLVLAWNMSHAAMQH